MIEHPYLQTKETKNQGSQNNKATEPQKSAKHKTLDNQTQE